jgi:hypothetical protein
MFMGSFLRLLFLVTVLLVTGRLVRLLAMVRWPEYPSRGGRNTQQRDGTPDYASPFPIIAHWMPFLAVWSHGLHVAHCITSGVQSANA